MESDDQRVFVSSLYNSWKDVEYLPIECVVNMVLLHMEAREIIQFDVSYYEDEETKEAIQYFLRSLRGTRTYTDGYGNIVVFLEKNREKVEEKLKRIGSGDVDKAFRTADFADMLDPEFYKSRADLTRIFKKGRAVQTSINVIRDEARSGALLVQMCDVDIQCHIQALYERFVQLSSHVQTVDPSLQTTLTFHTKPGRWKESPEYFVDTHRALPILHDK